MKVDMSKLWNRDKKFRSAFVVVVMLVGAVGLVAQITQNPLLNSYPLTDERQFWKSLTPFPAIDEETELPVPGIAQNNKPHHLFIETEDVDLFRKPIRISITEEMQLGPPLLDEDGEQVVDPQLGPLFTLIDFDDNTVTEDGEGYPEVGWEFLKEFRELNVGECTFSHNGDQDRNNPRIRQCKAADGSMVAPPLGDLLNPVGLAAERKIVSGQSVTGSAIYVVDQYNHRVQAFDFDGVPIPMAHPIGNGWAGDGTYAYPDGTTGTMLKEPYGIAVDAVGRILVADGLNSRIAIFKGLDQGTEAGLPAFGTHPAIPNGISNNEAKPNQVVLSRNTVLVEPGTTPLNPNDRIVVTDWTHCTVDVYDAGFNRKWSLPSVTQYQSRPPEHFDHDSCLTPDGIEDNPPPTPGAGEFVTLTGAAVDSEGRVYLADHYSRYVQVFDRDGQYLGRIGMPGEQPAPGALAGAVGLTIDHLDRLAVTDAGNARVAFYELEFPTVPEGSDDPRVLAHFQFQLDTTIAVDDFAIGFTEQVGAADGSDGLDPKGRFLATDPLFRRVLRFELPELAIINASANNATNSGVFQIAVPLQKRANVDGVGNGAGGLHPVSVTVVQPDCATTSTCVSVNVVVPVAPAPSVNSIAPGQYVQYMFTYAPQAGNTMPAAATFRIQAGSSLSAERHAVFAVARGACVGCSASHQVFDIETEEEVAPTPTPNEPVDGWYSNFVFVRISPSSAGVAGIQWWYEGEGAFAYQAYTRETPLTDDGYVDVPVLVDGQSWVKYRPITEEGSIGGIVPVPVYIDLHAPDISTSNWRYGSVPVDGRAWYNQELTFDYSATDAGSGVAEPDGAASETFSVEGRNLVKTVFATDYVGHTQSYVTNGSGGRTVNLDMTAPALRSVVFPATIPPITIDLSGVDEMGRPYGVVPDAVFQQWVADWVADPELNDELPVHAAGSGVNVASATKPGMQQFLVGTTSFPFTVADVAGNVSDELAVSITVNKAPVTISMPDHVTTYNGDPQANVCTVVSTSGATLAGTVIFSGGAPLYGPTTEPPTNAGTYTAVCAFTGDTNHLAGTDVSATLTINKAPSPITWLNPADIVYGTALDTTQLNASSTTTGSFEYSPAAGTVLDVGTGHVLSVSLTPADSANYLPATATVIINVTKATLTVTATALSKVYGDADPELVYSPADPSLSGALSRAPGESVAGGPYAITQGTLTSSNYTINFVPAALTIDPRPITVTPAADQGKTYGNADPALVCEITTGSLADGDTLAGACAREAGENVADGPYAITAGTLISGNPNYAITFTGGEFTIRRRPATLSFNFVTRMYGDPLVFDREDVTIIGTKVGDSLDFTFSTNALPTSPPLGAEGAGDYLVFVHMGDNPNYDVTTVTTSGTLRITPRKIAVTLDPVSKVYGQDDPEFTWQITEGNLVNDDVLGGDLVREEGEDAGIAYPIHRGQFGNGRYAITFNGASLTILKATPVVTWNVPADIVYGTVLGGAQLNATASAITFGSSSNVPGSFVYTPAAGALLAPGTAQTLSVAFTPVDTTNYNNASASVAINVLKQNQTIAFAPLANQVFGAADFPLGATASSELAVSYTASGACTVTGNTVDVVSVGSCTITASQAGNEFYNAAADVSHTFEIGVADQVISFAPLAGKTYGAADFAPGATSSSGLAVNYAVSGSCVLNGSDIHITAIGTCTITATQPGNESYNAAAAVSHSFEIARKALVITPASTSKVYGAELALTGFNADGLVNADSVSGVTLTSAGAGAAATVSGSPYLIEAGDAVGIGLGNYTISYGTGSLSVTQKALTITANVPSKVYGTALTFAGTEFAVSGLANSDSVETVSLSSSGAAATAGVSGSPYAVTVSNAIGSGLANYAITYAGGSLTVTPKALTIAVSPAARTKVYNTLLTFGTNEFVATGLVNGNTVTSVTLSSTGAAAAAGVAGSPYTITASNAQGSGLANNYAITYEHGSLTVTPATPVITWANPANIVTTVLLGAAQLNATAPIPGTFAYSPGAGTLLPVGTHTLSVLFTPADNVNYTTASKSVTISVLQGGPTCTASTITLNANSNTTGSVGNIRTFSAGGVSVKASAFSRHKNSGAWAPAFLGAFGQYGLGVTDTTENGNNNTHKVDNVGDRLNIIMFEFSQPVRVTKAFLTSIGADGDMTVLIGSKTDPFNNHQTPNDTWVTSLGALENSNSSSSADRWAAFNAAGKVGNILLIAADVTDESPDDWFKVAKLQIACVDAANRPPVITLADRTNTAGTALSVQVSGSDPDSDDVTYSATGLPTGLSMNSAGLITGKPAAGTYTVTVTIRDEHGATGSDTFVWTVKQPNRPPNARNDSTSTRKNTPKTVAVLSNDTDPDDDDLSITAFTQPMSGSQQKGSVVKNANGTMTFSPKSNWTGTVTFTYTVSDGNGGTDTATVTIDVNSHNDNDDCDDDHDRDGDRDDEDDHRERDCDRDHRHSRDCDRDADRHRHDDDDRDRDRGNGRGRG